MDVLDLLADHKADLARRDLNELQADPDLAKFLKTLQLRKYEIVYLAISSERALVYQKGRAGRRARMTFCRRVPVLARPSYHDNEPYAKFEADARRKLVAQLNEHYEVGALTRLDDTAGVYRETGIRCVVFGGGANAEEIAGFFSVKSEPEA